MTASRRATSHFATFRSLVLLSAMGAVTTTAGCATVASVFVDQEIVTRPVYALTDVTLVGTGAGLLTSVRVQLKMTCERVSYVASSDKVLSRDVVDPKECGQSQAVWVTMESESGATEELGQSDSNGTVSAQIPTSHLEKLTTGVTLVVNESGAFTRLPAPPRFSDDVAAILSEKRQVEAQQHASEAKEARIAAELDRAAEANVRNQLQRQEAERLASAPQEAEADRLLATAHEASCRETTKKARRGSEFDPAILFVQIAMAILNERQSTGMGALCSYVALQSFGGVLSAKARLEAGDYAIARGFLRQVFNQAGNSLESRARMLELAVNHDLGGSLTARQLLHLADCGLMEREKKSERR